MIDRIKWPVTVLLAIVMLTGAAVILFGHSLGIEPEVRREVMQWVKGGGAALGAVFAPLVLHEARQVARALAAEVDRRDSERPPAGDSDNDN